MKKVFKLNFSLIFLASIFLINCKSENKVENNISELNLSENLSDFTSRMTEKDTVRITVNLTMEYWVRIDELILTKKNNELILQTTIKEDTTFERKFKMRENVLPELNFKNTDNEFERHFLTNFRRTKIDSNEDNWIYRIINQKDTLKFRTVGLGDKGGCVREYFKFMDSYYPNKEEFKPIEVIEESEDKKIELKSNTTEIRKYAELILANEIYPSDDDETFECIKELFTNDKDDLEFYFKVFRVIVKKSDGALAEAIGLEIMNFIKFNPDFFLEQYSNFDLDEKNNFIGHIAYEFYFSEPDHNAEINQYFDKVNSRIKLKTESKTKQLDTIKELTKKATEKIINE